MQITQLVKRIIVDFISLIFTLWSSLSATPQHGGRASDSCKIQILSKIGVYLSKYRLASHFLPESCMKINEK
jgi:hypothetical protein